MLFLTRPLSFLIDIDQLAYGFDVVKKVCNEILYIGSVAIDFCVDEYKVPYRGNHVVPGRRREDEVEDYACRLLNIAHEPGKCGAGR